MSEEGKRAAADIAARLKELTEQRDELLAALRAVYDMCDGYVPNTSKTTWRLVADVLDQYVP